MPHLRSLQSWQLPYRRLAIGALIGLTALQPVLPAASIPTGGSFTAGLGNISANGNVLNINQSSLRGIIDWKTFSIGQNSSVNFHNGSGATLNRVTGVLPTSILGQLLASGSVYILNPEGILIGHGATVHTGGDFLASTLNIPNNAFLAGGSLLLGGTSNATVVNLGDLASTGGNVYLIGHSIQNGGSINTPNGTTGLAAGSQVLLANSATDQHVFVKAAGGDVTNSGYINAAQAELRSNGGNIYALAGNNGGAIRVTGTATRGGHAWLVAENGTANVSGVISAQDVDGTGGAIETSGAHVLTNGAHITTGAGGKWLLDPDNLTIDSTLAGTIETSLNGGTDVTEQTSVNGTGGSGDITVASNVAWTSGASLTLSAYHNIALNTGTTISNTGAGNLTLRADNAATGIGTITGRGLIDFSGSTGHVSLLYNPSNYASPTVYTPNFGSVHSGWTAPADGSVSSQYTPYMLVNNAANLQNIDLNDAGTYALGRDIDASSIANFTPLGSNSPYFTGILDGMNRTISNLTFSGASLNRVGLFDTIAAGGQVRNLNLANVNLVTSSTSDNTLGALAAVNYGTISNVSAVGSLTTGLTANFLGGLVGNNQLGGIIQNSSSGMVVDASANSTGGNVYAGGLVGFNTGAIKNSSATQPVTVGLVGNAFAGGLVGLDNGGTITNSYATGAVTVSDPNISAGTDAGGLVGKTSPSTIISNSFATGAVSGLNAGAYVGVW